MTHCEKCINYDMCKAEHESLDGTVLSFFPNNKDCHFFKNKADFVEVVRCKDCGVKGAAFCMCGDIPLTETTGEMFCSLGERSDI